eukprot:gene35319-43546_t
MCIALTKNLANHAISDVYLLTEIKFDFTHFPNVHKIHQAVIGHRMTFQDGFRFANEHLRGRVVALANSDIYFDASLLRLRVSSQDLKLNRHVISLLKWHHRETAVHLTLRTDSQDAWIFQAPIDQNVVDMTNFPLGVPKCDNRLAHILESQNYTVINPVFALHAIRSYVLRFPNTSGEVVVIEEEEEEH